MKNREPQRGFLKQRGLAVEPCPLGTGILVRDESSNSTIHLSAPEAKELLDELGTAYDCACQLAGSQFETVSSLFSKGLPIYEIAWKLGTTSAKVEQILLEKGLVKAKA